MVKLLCEIEYMCVVVCIVEWMYVYIVEMIELGMKKSDLVV